MVRVRILVPLSVVAGLAVAVFACEPPMPGTNLGIFAVAGTPLSNTCGAGLDAPNPWNFNVSLSVSGSVLYWNWLDGSAVLSTNIQDASANLTLSQVGNVDGTADGGLGPCDMERDDAIDLVMGGGALPSSFTGTITYNISVTSGATCTDQLVSSGGLYDTLPCTISYAVTGNQTQ
jgi:hypothetical protein